MHTSNLFFLHRGKYDIIPPASDNHDPLLIEVENIVIGALGTSV